MRFAISLSLAAIGVSFLLPSDGYKAALFILCAGTVALFMPEPQFAMSSVVPASEEAPEGRVDDEQDRDEQAYEHDDDAQSYRK